MSLSRNLSRPASAAAAAIVLFFASWGLLHAGWFTRGQIVDTPVYEKYGWAMAKGEVPYRDFSVEYPPGALPMFVLPAIGTEGHSGAFRAEFEGLMNLCGAALLVSLAVALAALGASTRRLYGSLALAAVSPLLLGSVVLTRFDLWPAAVTAGALAALVSGRLRLGHGLLGAGIAAKVWPGVLVPLAVVHVWRTRGRREALVCLAVSVAVVAVVVLPFAVLAPHGLWSSLQHQLTRPLQIESFGAALIVAAHKLLGTGAAMVSSHGSQNLGGGVADALGIVQTLLQLGALVAIWLAFARRERSREELVRFAAAAVVAFVALGKVLSPQFLIWLIPLVPLVRRRSAQLLFAAALVLTQAWFPQRYWDYVLRFDGAPTALVVTRDLVLLALLGLLLLPERRGKRQRVDDDEGLRRARERDVQRA